jgi:simple sugar transport system permease protein
MNVNEIITTLMMNYIAILWVSHLLVGPWMYEGFPWSPIIPLGAQLPSLPDSRLHMGIFFGIIAAVLIYVALMKTKWGYETRVVGENIRAARYAGISIFKTVVLAVIISGGLAGIAGMVQISAIHHRIMIGLSPGYGYTAVVIALLGKLNPIGVIIASIVFGGLLVGTEMMQRAVGIPVALIHVIESLVLILIITGEFFIKYRIQIKHD